MSAHNVFLCDHYLYANNAVVRAKKSYGQHFLINEGLCMGIAESVPAEDTYDILLEVGPGRGALTKYLLDNPKPFFAVEADWDMVGYLHDKFPAVQKDQIILKDFLKLDFQETFGEQQICLIGNFPYNISSQIVFKVLENRDRIPTMIGMFQRELADRVLSKHGSKTYGGISVMTDLYYAGKSLFTVSPGSFSPPPKVDSRVIQLSRKENPPMIDFKSFKMTVKSAFGQRRKMLRNSLKGYFKDKSILEQEIFSLRPEQLTSEDFIYLTELIIKHKTA